METTFNQRAVIRAIVGYFDSAISSNDFSSPSHNSLIDDWFNELVYDEILTQEQADEFSKKVSELHWMIDKIE